jgi:hypothetical protein
MDASYFLKKRTAFIRFFYEVSVPAFASIEGKIEREESPFDNASYSEDPEPPFLQEWMDARTGVEVLGQACVSLLSDSLKLYFETLRIRVIGFNWPDEFKKLMKREGFVTVYKQALGEILQTDWSDCPVRFDVIEQTVLARNRGQHGTDLTTLSVSLDGKTLEKHPFPFFTSDEERQLWIDAGGNSDAFLTAPELRVTRDNLFEAITQVELLADWVEGRMDRVVAWRHATSSRSPDPL